MRKTVLVYSAFLIGLISFGQEANERGQLILDVTYLSHDSLEGRETGTKGEMIAAEYIAKRYSEIGLTKAGSTDSSYYQLFSKKLKAHPHDTAFTGPLVKGRNIIGLIDNHAKRTIVIGAHYDHLGWGSDGSLHTGDSAIHNGADDNASGVAALLMLAKRLSEKSYGSNFLFIAFSGEEKGLLGSNYFINNLRKGYGELIYMVNMDMVGRLDSNRRLAVYGVGTSPSIIPAIEEVSIPSFQFVFDSSGVGPSDHTSFYLSGVPVVHFFTGQHAQYHRPEDDVELINIDGLFDVASFIDKLIMELEREEKLTFTKTVDKSPSKRGFNVTLGVIPDYLFSGNGLKIDGVKIGRAAEIAGIIKGDVVVQMGDLQINGMGDYVDALNLFEKGDTTDVVVLRNEKRETLRVIFD